LGVAALVLGIIGTLFSLIPGLFWIGCILGLIALVLGIFGRKAAVAAGQPAGTATAGMVLGIVGLIIGVLMWVLCSMMISGAKRGIEDAMKNPENWRPKSQPLSGEVIKVTPKQLLADYSANEVSADMKYKGKTIEISGPIESISKDLFDNIYVAVEAGDPIRTIQCYFDADNTKKVAALTKGQKITVQGRGDGLMMNVVLRDSVLK
jgi:tRNA_anti-like